jgi:hypothetical protein
MLQQLLANQAEQATLEGRIETNMEKHRGDLKEITEDMNVKMNIGQANVTMQEEMLAEIRAKMNINLNEMREDIKSSQAEMRSTVCAKRPELD